MGEGLSLVVNRGSMKMCFQLSSSEEWNKIDKDSREKIGLTFDEDGEFWYMLCLVDEYASSLTAFAG
jgi:hypothetical protein